MHIILTMSPAYLQHHVHPRPAQYWSDAIQTCLVLINGVVQQVPPLAFTDNTTFSLVDSEMAAILCGLCMIGMWRNALTPMCCIPPKILAKIFLFYQQQTTSAYPLECPSSGTADAAGGGRPPWPMLKDTAL
jgi:hypothetical protein